MSLLTHLQDACDDIGIPRPSSVIGSTEDDTRQLLRLSNKEGKILSARWQWNKQVKEVVFTAASATSQGTLTSITSAVAGGGSGFDYIINDTIWNRTLNRPVFGPLSWKSLQLLRSAGVTGPYPEYIIRNNQLVTIPLFSTGDSVAFEFKSKHWCESSSATATYAAWNSDTDVAILDEDLMTLGVVWRWKKAKGLDYAEEFRDYEKRVLDSMARDGGKPKLKMDAYFERRPGIYVPEGTWSGS